MEYRLVTTVNEKGEFDCTADPLVTVIPEEAAFALFSSGVRMGSHYFLSVGFEDSWKDVTSRHLWSWQDGWALVWL